MVNGGINTGGFDVILQFRPEVLGDALSYVLDDPTTTLPQSSLFLPRQIAFPPSPETPSAQFWWEQPTYQIDDNSSGVVTVAVPIHGGVRVQQSIYSVDGEVQLSRAARLVTNSSGTPFLRLDEPDLTSLDLRHLTFSYAGRPQPPHTVFTGASAYLLPACLILFRTLAKLPCSYMIEAPQLMLAPRPGDAPARAPSPGAMLYPQVALGGALHFLNTQGSAVALGFSLTGAAPNPSALTVLLPEGSGAHGVERLLPAALRRASLNTTLTLTDAGINHLLDQALRLGVLAADAGPQGTAGGGWRWEALHAHFREGVIALSGSLATDRIVSIEANLACSLDEHGHLRSRTLALRADGVDTPADTPLPLTVASAWQAAMLRLLRAAPVQAEAATQRNADLLVQRFIVPETQVRVECPARLLLVHDGALTLGYAVPKNPARLLQAVADKIS